MKDFLAGVGVVLLILCGLMSVVTVQVGGVRHVDEAGRTTETLTWQGWQPAAAPPESVAPLPVSAAVGGAPIWSPTPPAGPPAAPSRPSPLPPVADTAEEAEDGARDSARVGVAAASAGGANATAESGAARFSPWEVLGWTLVGLVPVGGVSTLGLVVYRQVALTRARVAALRAAPDSPSLGTGDAAGVGGPAATPAQPGPEGATEDGVATDVAVFLGALAAPPGGER